MDLQNRENRDVRYVTWREWLAAALFLACGFFSSHYVSAWAKATSDVSNAVWLLRCGLVYVGKPLFCAACGYLGAMLVCRWTGAAIPMRRGALRFALLGVSAGWLLLQCGWLALFWARVLPLNTSTILGAEFFDGVFRTLTVFPGALLYITLPRRAPDRSSPERHG